MLQAQASERELIDQFPADARLPGQQDPQDPHPRRMGNGPRQTSQLLIRRPAGRRGLLGWHRGF